MVSIVMITYKHADYIEEAILSIINQRCAFDFELVIADDNSPDQTEQIVRKIIEEHPSGNKILYTKHPKNKGMMGNFIWAFSEVRYKYVALCEGDDYWTSPNKLQKQVDFMESNLEFSMCFHSVDIVMAHASDHYAYPIPNSDVLLLDDVINAHYIPTCSLLLRKECINGALPLWFAKSVSGDIPLEILLSSKGKTKFF